MKIPFFSKPRPASPFTAAEQLIVTNAIAEAEKNTSGEVRVFIEEKCAYVDALDRAKEVFAELKMQQTSQRNGCLVYIATGHHQLAIYADEGIYQKMESGFWNGLIQKMIAEFRADHLPEGIAEVVLKIGEALKMHFPYNSSTDVNELSNDIVFG